MMNIKDERHHSSGLDKSPIQNEYWNSKLESLADTLLHHIKDEEEQEKPGSKGVYIDFKQL
jgi:hypothetical protein